jgi:hypothetical protein
MPISRIDVDNRDTDWRGVRVYDEREWIASMVNALLAIPAFIVIMVGVCLISGWEAVRMIVRRLWIILKAPAMLLCIMIVSGVALWCAWLKDKWENK